MRVGVGTRFRYDGETVGVIAMAITATGNEVVLKDHHGSVMWLAVKELLLSDRARVIPDGPGPSSNDDEELVSVVLAQLSRGQREALLEKAAHIREVLTGYRSGSAEMAEEGEPKPQYAPDRALYQRYADKAAKRLNPLFRLSTKRNRDIADRRRRSTASCGLRGPVSTW